MKRKQFLSEVIENILSLYEAEIVYEEQFIGEFENKFEVEYFNDFIRLLEEKGLVLDLACGNGRVLYNFLRK